MVTVSSSKIHHIMGASSRDGWQKTLHLFKANTCLLFDVYYRLGELAFASLMTTIHAAVNSAYCLKKKNDSVLYANLLGVGWALVNFRYLWNNRLRHWSKTKISHELLKEKFVRVSLPVSSYFLPSKLNDDRFKYAVSKYELVIRKNLPLISKKGIFVSEQQGKYIKRKLVVAGKSSV